MLKSPLISIIIPTYNRADIIGQTLNSIINQTYINWECIVVDDGSKDQTVDLMSKLIIEDSRFSYYIRPKSKEKGPSSCRNYGFEKSKGDIINFFDSDDLYDSSALENVISAFNNDKDAVIVKTDVIDFKTGELINRNKVYSKNLIQDYFLGKITFYVGGVFWQKNYLLAQTQLFDEGIRNADDWDFNLRMLYENPKLIFLEETLIQYRIHKESLAHEPYKLNKTEIVSDFKARQKHYKLISSYKNIDLKLVRKFIIARYKKYYIRALYRDKAIKYFLFRKLLFQQVRFSYFYAAFKTIVGFMTYLFFKKGYVFNKD